MKFLWQQWEPSETLAKFSVLTNESSAGSVLPSNLLENELLTCILENQANLMDHQTCSSCILIQYQFYLIALILEIDLIIHLGILSWLFKNGLFNLRHSLVKLLKKYLWSKNIMKIFLWRFLRYLGQKILFSKQNYELDKCSMLNFWFHLW